MTSSNGTTPRSGGFSPEYKSFLNRMGMQIIARGGSMADFGDYVKHAENHPGVRYAVEEPPSPDEDPMNARVGQFHGLTLMAVQGATYEWGDEAFGSLAGIVHGVGAQEGRDIYRATVDEYRKANPWKAGAAEMAGGLLTAQAAGVPLNPLTPSALGAGAAGGAMAGAGMAQGGIGPRAIAGLSGGFAGALLAKALPPAIAASARGAASGAQAGINLVDKLIPGTQQALADWGSRLLANIPGTAARRSRELVLEALAKEGKTPAQLAAQAEMRASQGVPTTLIDLTGDHVGALAKTSQLHRSPIVAATVDAYLARGAAAGPDLLSRLNAVTTGRVGIENAYHLAEQLKTQGVARSLPLYKEAFQQVVQTPPTLVKMLNHPENGAFWRKMYDEGRSTAMFEDAANMDRGLPVPDLASAGAARPGETMQPRAGGGLEVTGKAPVFNSADFKQSPLTGTMVRAQKATPVPEGTPAELPVRAIDYMKKRLDNYIQNAGKEGRPVLDVAHASALRKSLNDVLSEVDAQVPVYAQARHTAQESITQQMQLDLGREFLDKAPEQVTQEIGKSPHPDMYRIGAMQRLADELAGNPADMKAVQKYFGANLYGKDNTALRRIQALIPDKSTATEFADKVAGQAAVKHTVFKAGPPQPQRQAATLTPPGISLRIARFAKIGGKPNTSRAADIGDELTHIFALGVDGDPGPLIGFLHSMSTFKSSAAAQQFAQRFAAGATGAKLVPQAQAQLPGRKQTKPSRP